MYHRCRLGAGSNLGFALDGGMSDWVAVPERCLVPLPPGLSAADACLAEPMAVVLHGLQLARAEAGMRVAVVGGGPVGLMSVAAVRALGCEVSLVARHRHQLAAGERLGAKGTSGEYDLVIDAATTADGLVTAAGLAAPCPADLSGDGAVGIEDLLGLLAAWGTPGGDIDGDGTAGIMDLLALLAAWGPCR